MRTTDARTHDDGRHRPARSARRATAVIAGTVIAMSSLIIAVDGDPAAAVGPTVPSRGATATTARPASPTTARSGSATTRATRTTARSNRSRTTTTVRRRTATVRGDFSVSIQDESVGVAAGSAATTRVFINATDGFASPVTMSPRDIPDGITVRVFSPIRESARVDIAVADDVPDGSYPVAIRGTAGGKSRTGEFTIIVGADATTTPADPAAGPTTTAPPIGGIARPISPTPGVDATTTTVSPTATTAPTTATTVPGATVPGATVPGATTTTLGAPVPTDVVVSLVPATLTIAPGQSSTTAVVVAVNVNTTGNLTLGVTGLPAGVTATFAPPVILSGLSTLTIAVPAATPVGTYPFQVTATAGTLVRVGRGSLTVGAGGTVTTTPGTAAPTTTILGATTVPGATTTVPAGTAGDLALSVANAVVTVANGTSGSLPITVTGTLAAGALISVAGAPPSVAVLVSPNPVTAGVATLTFFVNGGTAPASSAITVTARNGGVTRQLIVLLTTT